LKKKLRLYIKNDKKIQIKPRIGRNPEPIINGIITAIPNRRSPSMNAIVKQNKPRMKSINEKI